MNNRPSTLPRFVIITAVAACALAVSGCAKKEPAPAAPAAPAAAPKPTAPAATPAATPAAAPAAPAPATKPDPVQSMVSSATKAAEATAAQVKETVSPAAPASAAPASAAAPATPAAATTPSAPAALPTSLTALQGGTQTAGEGTVANLAASATAIQKQAEELLTRYSGELSTLKSGALAVKNYVDQHPELLPEAAKAKYQQLNAMVPQLESLVGTLKDYKSVDLTTLVPKLQNDFAKAKSLYSEVRALLPANI